MTEKLPPAWVHHPAVRFLRGLLPAPVRALLWRTASATKRLRSRLLGRLPSRLRARLRSGAPIREGVRVRPGRHLPVDQAAHVPVVMIVALGIEAEELDKAVAAVAWQQTLHVSFVPLFVTDVADSRAFRRHEYLYEYIPAFADWSRFNDPELWPGFLEERLAELVDTYRPASVSTLNLGSRFGGVGLGITPQTRRPPPSGRQGAERGRSAADGPVGRVRERLARGMGRYALR